MHLEKIDEKKYPEGETVKPGDLIWTNEGAHIRKVISEKSIIKSDNGF